MRLAHLLDDIITIPAAIDRDITRLMLDSRNIHPGDLFFAIKGTALDGRKYIPDAITRGAVAILQHADDEQQVISMNQGVPVIPIQHLQQQLGRIAARFYDYPAAKLRMLGVTGTNGKTSCTHFIAQMLEATHTHCGVMGTLGSGLYGKLGEAGLTTPDAITIQALLKDLTAQGAHAIAMEVSSHSIDQGRVNGIDYDIGIFTNLSQDHLDYHGDMATYAAVKRRFLAELPTKQIIINADDAYGQTWLAELAGYKPIYAYSLNPPQTLPKGVRLIHADQIHLSLEGMTAMVHTPWGSGHLAVPLIGRFNLSNILAVLTALCVYGLPFKDVLYHLTKLTPVPGRMQTLGGQGKPLAVVDYSHTPDSLKNALEALRAHTRAKLICVFGCGGDRDTGKRPQMAHIAESLADLVIVTNDNPRHEDPNEIARQIMQGFSHPERVLVELNRSKAIEKSIQLATADDCVLIAGKGAERYQQIGEIKHPFDDIEQVKTYL